MGARSNGPIRAALYGSADKTYQTTANARCMSNPMIETKQAVENLTRSWTCPALRGVHRPLGLGILLRHEVDSG
ncbi:hypothetical protein M427DRAFT_54850 [Gonapodya prolifera JEL478]|uniref:Uncharacterized protein n=1 Tax=Gonapodya prolifera (strain JEL478) TaxID=1344416 RepID=A0A139AK94_GONPJ|nr:hypothetical protein M427DRAFT_54850 [Gonapodya prolifera JEL478]|eukprot:KXS17200.1 hypothetical protein M427DRAFT_54850 [Gonapodya prolifera JEL478]